MATQFANKFEYISPTWFIIRLSSTQKHDFELVGEHDVDQKWMQRIKANQKITKIVPRFLFENWRKADFEDLFQNSAKQSAMVHAILGLCKYVSLLFVSLTSTKKT